MVSTALRFKDYDLPQILEIHIYIDEKVLYITSTLCHPIIF